MRNNLLEDRGIQKTANTFGWQFHELKRQGLSLKGWRYPIYDPYTERPFISSETNSQVYRWKNLNKNEQGGQKYLWLYGQKECPPYYILPGTTQAIAEANGVVYIVGGEIDVLTMKSAGILNSMSWLNGEGSIPDDSVEIITFLGVNEVIYLADRDDAGIASVGRLAKKLQGTRITLKAYIFPEYLGEGADPNDLWKWCKFDQDEFAKELANIMEGNEITPKIDNLTEKNSKQLHKHTSTSDNDVDWDAERTKWVHEEVMPCLDNVAPVAKLEGRIERRHCPSPNHPDKDPSFRISHDRDKDTGIPQCACGIQNESKPWDKVADWVGASPFTEWWKEKRRHLFRPKRATNIAEASNSETLANVPQQQISGKINKKKIAPDIATIITKDNHFAKSKGKKLYWFSNGVYIGGGEDYIKPRVKHILQECNQLALWSSHQGEETVKYISTDAPQLWEKPPLNVINVKNGLYDVEKGELLPHSPQHLSSIQLPVKYDQDATCPYWEQFLEQILPGDVVNEGVIWQIIALLITPDTSFQKALLLLGEGGNGKSRLLAGIKAFLGISNTTSFSIQQLENDRFTVANIDGKLANICNDLPTKPLDQTSMFKQLTGDDGYIIGEYKYGDHFQFVPFARLVFAANTPPSSKDSSDGFYDRWLVIFFGNSFRNTDQQISSKEIDQRLSDPKELSGVLNKALEYLPIIRKQGGITETPSMIQAHNEMRRVSEPLAVWLDQNTVLDSQAMIGKENLLNAYNKDAQKRGWPIMTAQRFGKLFKAYRPNINEGQRKYGGKDKVRVYIGISLR